MSGFVVDFGNPDRSKVESMLELIRHRGPHACGICENKKVIMAQNYLRADGPKDDEGNRIPVASSRDPNLAICYDGQIGNWDKLPLIEDIKENPFREERLILKLYEQSGKDLFQYLDDAIFAFVISDGEKLIAARDLLGIKTLFYGRKNNTLYLASELKSITKITDEVFEFPPGHHMNADGNLSRFAKLPEAHPQFISLSVEEMIEDIRAIIYRSFRNRVDFDITTGSLLSGGFDSSVICCLANGAYKEKFGPDAKLKTFSLGVGESEDIHKARIVADHLGTEHHEFIADLKDLLKVLPEVIYYLESFDPALVRSAVSNYLISRHAKEQGIETLLSGEGGDELFCGYNHLKALSTEEIFAGQIECLGFLHNNASLRLDRMNQCNSVRVVTPLISGELLKYSLRVPPEYKMKEEGGQKIEKWIFRKAFEGFLPDAIVWRVKQEFSQGSGSDLILPAYFEDLISDAEFKDARAKYPMVRSKEELYYLRIFTGYFGAGRSVETVGLWPRV